MLLIFTQSKHFVNLMHASKTQQDHSLDGLLFPVPETYAEEALLQRTRTAYLLRAVERDAWLT